MCYEGGGNSGWRERRPCVMSSVMREEGVSMEGAWALKCVLREEDSEEEVE